MRTTTPTTGATSTTRPAARPLGRVVALGAAASLSLVLAACGGDDAGSMEHSSMASEFSTTSASPSVGATDSAANGVGAERNDQDVMFAQMMIVHHQGAVEMAQMATTRASSQQVKDLAAKIEAAQRPEIEEMTSWLNAWGAPATAAPSMTPMTGGTAGGMEGMDHSATPSTGSSSMGGMDHSSTSGMPGMMSEEQVVQLQNVTGTDFDRMFLQLMIEHHTGAVQMAQTEQQQGSNPQAQELADSIVTSQSGEIEQMKQMLTTLG